MRIVSNILNFIKKHFSPIGYYTQFLENPKTRIITIILTIIYLLSPIDLIPDFIPILGWIDDGVLLGFLIQELLKMKDTKKENTVDSEDVKN
jgi:uncharacterized membrane protein YkvA (DUF1232 family)